jgi:hypothetical protein
VFEAQWLIGLCFITKNLQAAQLPSIAKKKDRAIGGPFCFFTPSLYFTKLRKFRCMVRERNWQFFLEYRGELIQITRTMAV